MSTVVAARPFGGAAGRLTQIIYSEPGGVQGFGGLGVRAMDGPCKDFLLVNIIFAAINTILLGVLIWQLWVARSRFARIDSVVGGIVIRVQSVAQQIGRTVEWVITRR